LQYISAGSSGVSGQYVSVLAYHVMTVWFTTIKLSERRKYVPFIIKHVLPPSLKSAEPVSALENLDENSELVLDMVSFHYFRVFSSFYWSITFLINYFNS
jgi:hypothetical protein